jgi:DNA-binding NarL/FixJ family response regulator
MTTIGPITVVLVDDHDVVRRGVRDLLTDGGDTGVDVIGEAASVAEAMRVVLDLRPDVAVLDIGLPDGDGISLCRALRAELPDLHVLMLTSFSDDEALYAAILAGAAGYLLKQIRGTELLQAVLTVGNGGTLLDRHAADRVLSRMRAPHADDAVLASLTDQEHRVLNLVADGLTNRQIGDALGLAEKTVKNYMSCIFVKLGLARRSQAAVYGAPARARTERRLTSPAGQYS